MPDPASGDAPPLPNEAPSGGWAAKAGSCRAHEIEKAARVRRRRPPPPPIAQGRRRGALRARVEPQGWRPGHFPVGRYPRRERRRRRRRQGRGAVQPGGPGSGRRDAILFPASACGLRVGFCALLRGYVGGVGLRSSHADVFQPSARRGSMSKRSPRGDGRLVGRPERGTHRAARRVRHRFLGGSDLSSNTSRGADESAAFGDTTPCSGRDPFRLETLDITGGGSRPAPTNTVERLG